jgi:NADH dehydrogenase FAD-containing subunit
MANVLVFGGGFAGVVTAESLARRLGHVRSAVSESANASLTWSNHFLSLFTAQSDQRINLRRPPRWYPTRQQRYKCE